MPILKRGDKRPQHWKLTGFQTASVAQQRDWGARAWPLTDVCPHCGARGRGMGMVKHHFDNCGKRYDQRGD